MGAGRNHPHFNGVIRMMTYGKALPEPTGSLISSACDVLLVATYALLLQRRPKTRASRPELRGLLWLTLSTLNHFLLGHFGFGLPYEQLLKKYDISDGQTWGLISLAIGLAPIAAAKLLTPRRVVAPAE